MEGREVSFGTGSACPNFLDPRSGERRPFTEADVIECVRLVDSIPQIDFCMSMGMPSDLNPRAPYCDEFALMLENTTKPLVFTLGSRNECEAIVAMARGGRGNRCPAPEPKLARLQPANDAPPAWQGLD